MGCHVPLADSPTVERVRLKGSQGPSRESHGRVQGLNLLEELGCNPHSILTPRLIVGVRRDGRLISLLLLHPPTDLRVSLQLLHQHIAPTAATQLCPGAAVILMLLQLENRKLQIAVLADGEPQRTLGLLQGKAGRAYYTQRGWGSAQGKKTKYLLQSSPTLAGMLCFLRTVSCKERRLPPELTA